MRFFRDKSHAIGRDKLRDGLHECPAWHRSHECQLLKLGLDGGAFRDVRGHTWPVSMERRCCSCCSSASEEGGARGSLLKGLGEISLCSCADLMREPLPCRQATASLMHCWLHVHNAEASQPAYKSKGFSRLQLRLSRSLTGDRVLFRC